MRLWVCISRVIAASAAFLAAAGWAAERSPQYPVKPVRIVAPSGPGSAADTLARTIAPPLSERLGQPVIVDTRPGAGSILGTELVAKAPPDGYTLVIATPALAINLSIARNMPYDALHDFATITLGMKQPNVFAVHPERQAAQQFLLRHILGHPHPGNIQRLRRRTHQRLQEFLPGLGRRALHKMPDQFFRSNMDRSRAHR